MLRAGDVNVPEGVTIINDHDDVVARVALERVAVEEVAKPVAEKVAGEAEVEGEAAEEESG